MFGASRASTAYDGMWVSGAAAATADPAPRAETARSTTAKMPDARTIAHETRGGNCGRPSARRISQKAPHPIAAARMMNAGQSSRSVNRITASAMRIAHGQLPVTRRARSSATAAKRARTIIGLMRTSRLVASAVHRPRRMAAANTNGCAKATTRPTRPKPLRDELGSAFAVTRLTRTMRGTRPPRRCLPRR